ncbi:MAG: Fic/DOC family N-terminal domain-containing protein [Bacteroidota bacterium]
MSGKIHNPYPVNSNRAVPWNELPPLPIDESLYKTVEVTEQLGEAKAALARLHGRSVAIPNQGMLINTISLQEAKASSEVENIFTTDDELYQAFSQKNIKEQQGPAKEVLYYREALWKGYEYLKNREEFDIEYLISICQEIKHTSDGIRPPYARIFIKRGGSGLESGKAIYTPPRGEGILENKLTNLLDYLNDNEKYKTDTLLKMVIGHFQFEAIHPFRDGNGRTGRIFNIHYLTHKGLLDYPILFLSKYIIENKEDYYYGLQGIIQRGDWKTWILFMLRAVEITSNITFNKINEILTAKEDVQKAIEMQTDIKRPELMIRFLFTQPFTRVKHFTEAKIYAENTARNYLNRLCEIGVLEKKTINGHHYYLNIDLYRILSE